jgi:hypothetical protein
MGNEVELALGIVLSRHGAYSQALKRDLAEAVRDLLGNEHVVVVTDDHGGWIIEHSLDCRLSGNMAACEYSTWLHDTGFVPYKLGRYLPSWLPDGDLDFEPIKAEMAKGIISKKEWLAEDG